MILPHLNSQSTLSPLEIYRRNHGKEPWTRGYDNNPAKEAESFRQLRRVERGIIAPDDPQAAPIWAALPPEWGHLQSDQAVLVCKGWTKETA